MDEQQVKTLLLVEDEAIIAVNQARRLERTGFRVLTSATGERAVEIACGDDPIDLVLMDINLGMGIDGTEAARRILARRDLPIVFLTSHSEREMVEKVRGITRYGYVIKNSGDLVLQTSIEMAFELHDAHREARQKGEALRERTQILENILESFPGLVYWKDRASVYQGCNANEAAASGLSSPTDIVGKTDADFPWSANEAEAFVRDDRAVMESGVAKLHYEERQHVAGGEVVVLDTSKVPLFDASGEVVGVLGVSTDITAVRRAEEGLREALAEKERLLDRLLRDSGDEERALRRSEARYRAMFEKNPAVQLIIDPSTGRILKANPAAARFYGYPLEELTRLRIGDINQLDPAEIAERMQAALAERRNYFMFPHRLASGEVRQVEVHSSWIELDGERVLYSIIHDITESLGSRARVEHLASDLQSAYQEKRDLLEELQHRVKNSFGLITSLVSLTAMEVDAGPARVALEELEGRVRSISQLYSFLYSSGSYSRVRLDEYCSQVIEAMSGFSKGISIDLDMDEVEVEAKAAAPIALILTELLTNAFKHAFPGGRQGRVLVSLKQDGSRVELAVRDQGIGLPPGFDPTTDSGLGLQLIGGLASQVHGEFGMTGSSPGVLARLRFDADGLGIG